MEKIRLAVTEWEMGKERSRPGNGVLDCDRDVEEDEEGGELGSWLDIALQRSKFQRQISPERSVLGDGPGFNHEESTSVSSSYPYVRQGLASTQQTMIIMVGHCAEQVLLHSFYYVEHELSRWKSPWTIDTNLGKGRDPTS